MTVTVNRLRPARKPRQPRPTHSYSEISGTREEVLQWIAEAVAEIPPHNPYNTNYSEPVEQPDGTWLSKGSSSLSCD